MSLKVAGYNDYWELIAASNNKSNESSRIICPPIDTPLDPKSLLSFSSYFGHSVWVTKTKHLFASGNNGCCRISNQLKDSEIFDSPVKFNVNDSHGQIWNIESAVCGYHYTLYMGSPIDQPLQLLYFYHNRNNNFPLIFDLGIHHPVAIFGGKMYSAAIDEEGAIFVISQDVFNKKKEQLPRKTLPNGERAIFVACCDKFMIALSSTGHVYGIGEINEADQDIDCRIFSEFAEINELKDKNIIHISGTSGHCFAVSEDGKVFALGSNQYGQLGIGQSVVKTSKFTEISSLSSYKIFAAYAGSYHSLFQTVTGKILSCGYNGYGDLFLEKTSEDMIYTPIDTVIKSGATFCIAGNGISAVFVNCPPPENCPNKTIMAHFSK